MIPNNPTRKCHHPFDHELYRGRSRIERTICRLKDFRRIATRSDKPAQNYLAAVHIAAIMAFWL
nr:transposase [Microvirga calopogonii]